MEYIPGIGIGQYLLIHSAENLLQFLISVFNNFKKNSISKNYEDIFNDNLSQIDCSLLPFTKEELRRYKAIQKKLRIAEEKRIVALKADQDARKQSIRDLVDPPKVSKRKQKELQSNQAVSADTPSQLINIDKYIANLVRQQQDLFDAVQIRQAKLLLEQELIVLEAKRLAELDDEEALLLLL
jgi:hypothetical protein